MREVNREPGWRDRTWRAFGFGADVALGRLLQAYGSFGLDQRLWHVTSVEALLGAILGDTHAARKAIESRLRKGYAILSPRVHGSRFKEDLRVG